MSCQKQDQSDLALVSFAVLSLAFVERVDENGAFVIMPNLYDVL